MPKEKEGKDGVEKIRLKMKQRQSLIKSCPKLFPLGSTSPLKGPPVSAPSFTFCDTCCTFGIVFKGDMIVSLK